MTVESHFVKKEPGGPGYLSPCSRCRPRARTRDRRSEEELKSAHDIRSPRIDKREQTSPNRWHVVIRLDKPADVDRQLATWLKAAYELAGP